MNRWHVGLIVSLILNLFLAGALAAGYVSLRYGRGMIAAGSLRIAGAELPPDQRRAYRAALRETRRAMRPTVLAAREAKAQAAALLARPRVDQAAVLAALDRARVADAAVRAAVERRAVAFAATLPPAQRARLAEAMRRRAARGTQ
ncbi:periplasmic heavy metal sensor [Sphingomonas sp. RHCKR7]|uniref:periplasmic heavy metal sensor n=1 Tax=Sphingomonas folli TaxID=2862497 RepID=UPI001CA4D997|nr:periplasmic heavy metal sensor [Sphingomonas folli]MBW6526379.1 periplasmic heavy metal sensor [Sphingomonas folli]